MSRLHPADVEPTARQALRASPIYQIRQLSVEPCGDSLLISGRVDSYYLKQLAQEIVLEVVTQVPVVNSIDVSPFD